MNSKEDVIKRLEALIDKADIVLSTKKDPPSRVIAPAVVSIELFAEWQTQAVSYLINILGSDHIYTKNFKNKVIHSRPTDTLMGKGILKGVKEDIEGSYLQKIEVFLSAAIFCDFLEMADYLLTEGYKDPAASLIGAVLEDGLRKICEFNSISFKKGDGIYALNILLSTNHIYNRIMQSKIQVWTDIRNNADHGNFDEYAADDVKDMLKGVQDFLGQYLR